MKKMLFISNISNKITNFSIPSIVAGKNLGYEFHMAANYSGFNDDESKHDVTLHHIDIVRNPLNLKNIKAYRQMKNLIKQEDFNVIHCNTPIGGLLGRICGKKTGVSKVIYTAHGFHFYKGAPLINNTLFKWIELWLARYTDAIITINQEDYKIAQNFKLRNNGKVYFIPGVGIDCERYRNVEVDKSCLKIELGLKDSDVVLIAMGDLITRKNYSASIKAIAKTGNRNVQFLICGEGPELSTLKRLAQKYDIENQIHFLGFRSDIRELLEIADIFLFTTFQEGLPRSMMEAMAAGLPCISSKIRGIVDLIEDGVGGFIREPNDVEGFSECILKLVEDEDLRGEMGINNIKASVKYDTRNILNTLQDVYSSILTE